MDIWQWIIRAGAVAGAIAAMVAAARKIIAPIKDMHAKINKIAEHDHEQYLSILRLTVMSPEMPVSERLIAGKKYIDAGGNGDVKHYYENLVREHTK